MHPQKKGKKRVPERVQVLHLEVFSSASQLTGKNKPKKNPAVTVPGQTAC